MNLQLLESESDRLKPKLWPNCANTKMLESCMNTSAKPIIIGVSGTLSSGKDSLATWLEEQKSYFHKSTSDMLRAAKKKKFGDSPEALLRRADPFANELRVSRGAGILVELAYEEFVKSENSALVISGIRSIGEVEKLHELGGKLIFVDADPEVRYSRAQARARDVQDKMSLKEFLSQESSESENIDQNDKTIQNLPATKRMADYVILNNEDFAMFIRQAEQLVAELAG